MTNKSTKRALTMSVISMLICIVMLMGTTFAWFTDSVVSGKNKIVAGNLDVELEYKTDWADDWAPVTETTKVFKEGALYEPGYTEVVYLRVVNKGTLALKYNLSVNIADEKASTNVYDEEFKLSDYLMYGTYVQDEFSSGFNYADFLMPTMFGTREAALSNVTLAKLSEADTVITDNAPVLPGDDTSTVAVIVLTMPETVGNEANHKTDVEAPTVDLGINLVATQMTHEADSFDMLYDKNATTDDAKLVHGGVINLEAERATAIGVAEDAEVVVNTNGNAINNFVDNNGDLTVNGGAINAGTTATYASKTIGADAKTVYNDVDIDSAGGAVAAADGAEVEFNSGSVVVNSKSTSGRYLFYGRGAGTVITINGGDFSFNKTLNQKRAYICVENGAKAYVTGGNFGVASTRTDYTKGFRVIGEGSEVIVTGGTFRFDPTEFVADGYQAVENEGVWTVTAK